MNLHAAPAEAVRNKDEVLQSIPGLEDKRLAIVRIDLGYGATGRASEDGISQVEAMLDLFGRTGAEWRQAGILLQFADGDLITSSISAAEQEQESWQWAIDDGVSRNLLRQDGNQSPLALAGPVIEALRLRRSIRRRSERAEAVLVNAVRGVELVRAPMSGRKRRGSRSLPTS